MKDEGESRKLNRYTSLPAVLDLLKRGKLVLVDPSSWEDRNDSEIILEYKARRKIPKLFALCFSLGDQTIHHWKTYADGISGCCIEFDEAKLVASFRKIKELRWDDVAYMKVGEVKRNPVQLGRIPFTKRWGYRFDEEFRVIWEGKTKASRVSIDIDLSSITKITLSPTMYVPVAGSVRKVLEEACGDLPISIVRSTLYESLSWIVAFQ